MDPSDFMSEQARWMHDVSEAAKPPEKSLPTFDAASFYRGKLKPPPAQNAFETLKAELEAFQAKLDEEHEIAIGIFGGSSLIHVHTIRFDPPDVLLFEGFTPEGDETLAIQHVAQLNLQLVKRPKLHEIAFRVGFVHPEE